MTMDSRGLRVMLNDTHLKHRGLFGRAGENHRRRTRVRAVCANLSHKIIVLLG